MARSPSPARSSSPAATLEAPPSAAPDLLASLGLVGLGSLQPVVLASLATRSPLLLIGVHGSGKSLLLERLATALGLAWRHYNAALVNFDDLVGYPLPDERGQLRFVQTPASVWGAQCVFIDEISRARLDVQNRLFPIIHEKRVQGIALEQLEHRWAAMNPPGSDDDEALYAGSQPLDLALADRFALQARVPDWRAFGEAEQEAVIRAAQQQPDPDAGVRWAAALEATRARLPMVQAQWGGSIARYVRLLAALLAQAGAVLSARRAGMVAGNVAAVHAARLSCDAAARIEDSAWIAALNSMPFAAAGGKLEDAKLLACHREAWRQAAVRAEDPMSRILAERDPVARVKLALAATGLPDGELTTIVTDALASCPDGRRHALAEWLFEGTQGADSGEGEGSGTGTGGASSDGAGRREVPGGSLAPGLLSRLSIVAAEAVAETVRDVVCVQEIHETVQPNGQRHRTWKHLQHRLGALAIGGSPEQARAAERQGNLLATLFASGRIKSEADVDLVLERYRAGRRELFGAGAAA
ncbi:MAG: AAA family ATPase [Rubrivivax sp.]